MILINFNYSSRSEWFSLLPRNENWLLQAFYELAIEFVVDPVHQVFVQILHLSLLHLLQEWVLICLQLLLLLSHWYPCLFVKLSKPLPFFLVCVLLLFLVRVFYRLLVLHLFALEFFCLLSQSVPLILSHVHCLGELLVLLDVSLVNLLVECYLARSAPILSELVLYYCCALLYFFYDAIGLMPFVSKQVVEDVVIHWSLSLESAEMLPGLISAWCWASLNLDYFLSTFWLRLHVGCLSSEVQRWELLFFLISLLSLYFLNLMKLLSIFLSSLQSSLKQFGSNILLLEVLFLIFL